MNEIPEQPKIPSSEVYPNTVLLIDDRERDVVTPLGLKFRKLNNFSAVVCHNVESAMAAIKKADPQVILLDHDLTEDSSAGYKIAEQVWQENRDVRIFSTSTKWLDEQIAYRELARRLGAKYPVEYVDKNDLGRIEDIINF